MSGLEVLGLVLGAVSLFPLVIESWDRYRETSPDVASLEVLHTRFKATHQLYKSSTSRLFPGQNLDALVRNLPNYHALDTELQKTEIRELLDVLKPTAAHINHLLEDLKRIFTQEEARQVNGETYIPPFIESPQWTRSISGIFSSNRNETPEHVQTGSTPQVARSTWRNLRKRRAISHKLGDLKSDVKQFCRLVNAFRAQSGSGADQNDAKCYSEGLARYHSLRQAMHPTLRQCDCEYHDARLLLAHTGSANSDNGDSSVECLRLFISVPWDGAFQWTSVVVEPKAPMNVLYSSKPAPESVDSLRKLRLDEQKPILPEDSTDDSIGDADDRFSEIDNLCKLLSQEFPVNPDNHNPIGTISTDRSAFRLYIAGVRPEGRDRPFLKFQSALRPRGSAQIPSFRGLNRCQRLKLARDFAVNIFQLESTSWEEPDAWRLDDNDDIFLHLPQGARNLGLMEFYISRTFYFERDFTDLDEEPSNGRHPRFVNPTMWKLALVLIELCLNKAIGHLRLPGPEFVKAHSLMNTRDIEDRFGVPYKEAVQFCLFASTGFNISKSQNEFKAKVIDKIDEARRFYGAM